MCLPPTVELWVTAVPRPTWKTVSTVGGTVSIVGGTVSTVGRSKRHKETPTVELWVTASLSKFHPSLRWFRVAP